MEYASLFVVGNCFGRGLMSDFIKLSKDDLPQIKLLDLQLSDERAMPSLVGPSGEELPLPTAVYETLRRAVHLMAQGRPISIVPFEHELTTQEAAEMLNVSRPFLVSLLETNEIPFHFVGTHRRIRFADLMDYKGRRDTNRRQALRELTQLSEDMGLYRDQSE